MSSQLVFVIVVTSYTRNANIIRYFSLKSRRVTKGVIAVERFAASFFHDVVSTAQATFEEIFNRVIALILYTNSKLLYDSVVGFNFTAKTRLLTDLSMLRESYEMRELTKVV